MFTLLFLIACQILVSSFSFNHISKTHQLSRRSIFELSAIEDPPIRSEEWARLRGLVPGYGGYWPGNPDAKKYKVTIKSEKTGRWNNRSDSVWLYYRMRIHKTFEEMYWNNTIIDTQRMRHRNSVIQKFIIISIYR